MLDGHSATRRCPQTGHSADCGMTRLVHMNDSTCTGAQVADHPEWQKRHPLSHLAFHTFDMFDPATKPHTRRSIRIHDA
jgi:hypothetical protein